MKTYKLQTLILGALAFSPLTNAGEQFQNTKELFSSVGKDNIQIQNIACHRLLSMRTLIENNTARLKAQSILNREANQVAASDFCGAMSGIGNKIAEDILPPHQEENVPSKELFEQTYAKACKGNNPTPKLLAALGRVDGDLSSQLVSLRVIRQALDAASITIGSPFSNRELHSIAEAYKSLTDEGMSPVYSGSQLQAIENSFSKQTKAICEQPLDDVLTVGLDLFFFSELEFSYEIRSQMKDLGQEILTSLGHLARDGSVEFR